MVNESDLILQLVQKVESIGASQKVIDANFRDIQKTQVDIMSRIGRMEDKYDLMFSQLQSLCNEIHGNGKVGLLSKVNAMIWVGCGVATVMAMVLTKIVMTHFGFPS